MSSYPFVQASSVFNTNDYNVLTTGLTLQTANMLYLSLNGGVISGNLNVIGTLSINGSAIDLSLISGVVAGTPANSKVLTLDSSGNINGDLSLTGTISAQNLYASELIRTTRTTSGQTFSSINGTSTCVLYHFNNGDAYFGTTTANNLIFQTNNTGRMTINGSTGDITGISSLTATNITATNITGTLQTAVQPNITSIGTLTTLSVSGISSTSNTRITTTANYNGVMDTASIVLKQASVTNGNKIGLDFIISTNDIDAVNTATCSITHERILAYVGDLIFNTKRTATATAPLTEALRISSTGTVSIANTSSGFQLNLGASGTGITTNAITTTSLTLGATAITATGIELNYLDLTTGPGTAEASKALVLDSSKNIATLNLLTSNYLTANLAINSPNAIASFAAVNIGPIVTAYGISSIKGTVGYSSTFFGSTNSILWMENSNASVIEAEINISSGPGSTSTNGMRIGTCTANQFSLFTNATNRLIITSTGNVGIGSNASTNDKVFGILDGTAGSTQVDFRYGNALSSNNCFTMSYIPTSSGSGLNKIQFDPYGTSGALTILAKKYVGVGTTGPICPLDVAGFDSGLGILAPYQYAGPTSGDGGYIASGTTTGVNINARFQDNVIFDQKIYIRSDRRVKKDIVPLTVDLGIKFVEEVDPVLFRKKDQSSDAMMEIGYIAQDIMKAGFGNIITHTDNDKLKVEEEGDIENIQFNVDYSRVCAILHSVVKDQQKKINELESNFESILDELKEIKSNRKLQY